MFYLCDGINVILLGLSALIKYKDEFGVVKDQPKDTAIHMLKNGGALQIFFLLPWDIIPLVIASRQGQCIPFDTMYRLWALIRALKIIPSWNALIRTALESKIIYASVQVGRLMKSILGLLILVHMSACFFFSLSASQQSDKSWVAKVIINQGQAHNMFDQYIL